MGLMVVLMVMGKEHDAGASRGSDAVKLELWDYELVLNGVR